MNSIVVHYKELGLKGKNRPWFVRLLVRNIRTSLAGLGIPAVRVVMGRIEIDLGQSGNLDAVRERLRHVFGIAYFSYAGRAPLDVDGMAAAILSDLGDRHPASFRVSARRADKRKSTRLNSSHPSISYAVFCLKKKNKKNHTTRMVAKPQPSLRHVHDE